MFNNSRAFLFYAAWNMIYCSLFGSSVLSQIYFSNSKHFGSFQLNLSAEIFIFFNNNQFFGRTFFINISHLWKLLYRLFLIDYSPFLISSSFTASRQCLETCPSYLDTDNFRKENTCERPLTRLKRFTSERQFAQKFWIFFFQMQWHTYSLPRLYAETVRQNGSSRKSG